MTRGGKGARNRSQTVSSQERTKECNNGGNTDPESDHSNQAGNSLSALSDTAEIISRLDHIAGDFHEMKDTLRHIEKWIADKELADAEATEEKQQVNSRISDLENAVGKLHNQVQELLAEHKQLREHNLKLESHSRRDNLVLDGIGETPGENDRDCLHKVYDVLQHKLEIPEARNIKIVRCHRLGPFRKDSQRPRPIIFKLHWFGDRQTIWGARRKLKGSNVYLSENFPAEIERRRKILWPIVKEARRQDKDRKAYLAVDKLHIGQKMYSVDNLETLPASLNPQKVASPSNNQVTAFFSSASPLSNFFKTAIKGPDGTQYTSSEQMYQHQKALHYKDMDTAAEILTSQTPLQAYKLGKKVKGLRAEDWYTEENAKEVMYKCCLAKFSQNEKLELFLVSTGKNSIAEGNPRDSLWGVALPVSNPNIFSKDLWKGKNWMGDILTRVRDTLTL